VTQPQRHRVASEQLSENRFQFFLPWREEIRVARGRSRRIRIPYFGRYIFVVICDAWESILTMRGIAGMLLHPESLRPWLVNAADLDRVRALCDGHNVVHEPIKPVRGLCYGDLVYPKDGPLANIRGVYDAKVGKKREAAVFNMFGREQRVVFRRGELQAV
jgi:transcription antitermination factor NusG